MALEIAEAPPGQDPGPEESPRIARQAKVKRARHYWPSVLLHRVTIDTGHGFRAGRTDLRLEARRNQEDTEALGSPPGGTPSEEIWPWFLI